MAHKVRSELHRTVCKLLKQTGQPYSVYLSTALHEGTAFDERFTVVFDELREIYGDHIYFLGYMSDTAVYNYLIDTTFFAAFFDKGVRANNTTVNAAMECGSVVITNLDAHSPSTFDHMHNVIDIYRCKALPTAPDVLESLAANGPEGPRPARWVGTRWCPGYAGSVSERRMTSTRRTGRCCAN